MMDLNYDNWKLFADEFVSVLELQKQPIAITYSNEEVQSTMKKAITICKALLLVSSGEIICMSKTKCACPGGKWHVGFAEKRDGIENAYLELQDKNENLQNNMNETWSKYLPG